MTRKRQRMIFVLLGLLMLAGATALVLTAFRSNLVFFFSPTDLLASPQPPGHAFRLGGLVEQGSVDKASGDTVRFRITDKKNTLLVVYRGVLPDLFREGQGVVVEGSLAADGSFTASSVLAKHDEKYMPPEVAAALKKNGEWRPTQ
ncbi:MAG TPA: cytochrome c maturation protein CcmE [Candidatus Polarisedimenticolia bacterium]|jgi:cytochrome c-type biogenesis protein CcmE|nr:cytochrome c maturation protein CcmE [Dongiaceae bacterium]HYV87862.1 cytochrome c maturation protein CcmE [Candidatus Polarisedimenticolia bacterium]